MKLQLSLDIVMENGEPAPRPPESEQSVIYSVLSSMAKHIISLLKLPPETRLEIRMPFKEADGA